MADTKPPRKRAAATAPKAKRGGTRPGAGRKPIPISEEMREKVRLYAEIGTEQDVIAKVLGFSIDTLTRHCREELDRGIEIANARVGLSLYERAIAGEIGAIVWYEKTRMGKRDITGVEHTGANGGPITTFDLSSTTPEQRKALMPVLDQLLAAAGVNDASSSEGG